MFLFLPSPSSSSLSFKKVQKLVTWVGLEVHTSYILNSSRSSSRCLFSKLKPERISFLYRYYILTYYLHSRVSRRVRVSKKQCWLPTGTVQLILFIGVRRWKGNRGSHFTSLLVSSLRRAEYVNTKYEGQQKEPENSVTRLGDLLDFGQLLKPLAAINWPKSFTFLGNFCKDVKIFNFSNEIIFGQLLYFIDIWRLFTDNTVRDRHYKPFTVTWESPVQRLWEVTHNQEVVSSNPSS